MDDKSSFGPQVFVAALMKTASVSIASAQLASYLATEAVNVPDVGHKQPFI